MVDFGRMYDPYADRKSKILPNVRPNKVQKWLVVSDVRSQIHRFVHDVEFPLGEQCHQIFIIDFPLSSGSSGNVAHFQEP